MNMTKGERLVAMDWGREWLLMMALGFSIMFMCLLWIAAHPWDEEGGLTLQRLSSARAGQAGLSEHNGASVPLRQNGDSKAFELAGIVPPLVQSAPEEVTIRRDGPVSTDDSIYSSVEVDERPELIWMLFPELSDGDLSGNTFNEVVLNLIVNNKGEVEEAGLAGGDSQERFDSVQAALVAVKGAIFKPARRHNNNVRCRVEFRVKVTEG